MKFVSILLTLLIAGFTHATSDEDYDACWAPDGPCTKLEQAIASGKSLLNSPNGGNHNAHSKRAEEYLSAAIREASGESVSKRSPLPSPGSWCHWRGEGCGKVRRAASAIQAILGDESLEKRWANPSPGMWCHWRGEGCGKARRSVDALLQAANEVTAALPIEGETKD